MTEQLCCALASDSIQCKFRLRTGLFKRKKNILGMCLFSNNQSFYLLSCLHVIRPWTVPSSQAASVSLLWSRELRPWPSAYHWAVWTLAFEKEETMKKFITVINSSAQKNRWSDYTSQWLGLKSYVSLKTWQTWVHLSLMTLIVFIPLAAAICMTACPTPLLAAFWSTESPARTEGWRHCHMMAKSTCFER